jgi:hypothetical protein
MQIGNFDSKKFKVTHKMLRIAVIVLGVFLILFAIAKAVFKFRMDPKLENNISTYVSFGALAIFLWSRKLRKEEEAAIKAKEEEDEKAALATGVEPEPVEEEDKPFWAGVDDDESESVKALPADEKDLVKS